uniref:Cytochrome c oxidase subunit 5A, mitochondrial n=1 Tax=Oncorhynchus tshawytscha TaxID=74940 RepID=A0AAZ3PK57_ONCTS
MFRPVVRLSTSGVRSLTRTRQCYSAPLASRCYSHAKVETDEEFDARWVTYFSKPDIDAWELKKGMNTLIGYDLVPEPKILDSALRACRRLNDLASAIRILEAVKSPDLNPIEHLWRDLKIAVQQRSPSILTWHEDLQRRMTNLVPTKISTHT